MKIQKGKLSTSNAVVIGVLVIVLYFVIPTSSQKKRQNSELASAEESTQSQPKADLALEDATAQNKTGGSTSDTNLAVITETPSEVKLRTIGEIDEGLLAALSSHNPFWTTVIAKNARSLPEETQPTTAEVGTAQQEAPAAQEQVGSSGISLIYSSSTGQRAAVLNDEIVYPGSRISGKYRVVTVHPNGLGLRKETTPGTTSK